MATTRPIFRLDTVSVGPIRFRVVIKVEPHADPEKVQTAVWDTATAWKVQRDAEAQAARYEREADEFDAIGRPKDADITRAFASERLTFATDLLVVLQGAEEKAAA